MIPPVPRQAWTRTACCAMRLAHFGDRGLPGLRSTGKRSGDAESDVVAAGAALGSEPGRRTQEFRIARPGAAADAAPPAIALRPRRPVGRGAFVALVPAILDPLPDVALPLEEAPGVRLEAVGRNRLLPKLALGTAPVGEVPVVVRLFWRDRRAPPERRLGAGADHVFQLRLSPCVADFPRRAVGLVLRRAHHELAGRDHHHFGAVREAQVPTLPEVIRGFLIPALLPATAVRQSPFAPPSE